jgi:hypothetical protein
VWRLRTTCCICGSCLTSARRVAALLRCYLVRTLTLSLSLSPNLSRSLSLSLSLSLTKALGQHDSELLLSYLTVPYLRVPLVVSFFASEDRIHLLQMPRLQALLDPNPTPNPPLNPP